ncbi:hypothetical protein BASA50_001053 [Batrachochytrium salamandrivorans]|uniref:EF-hand domain-containing protein n=1 Tax=Batrachochytrium salamandrivorans TaxID=1357716 RepID=A0ABQ8ESD7_9FUNG|nr:hypothetical protein BASA50_001053 [Batrachochytrium salamandrivorans]KAH6588218.1 hypothetical protein BASA61_006027 [Batrachochytrium salamandrivorans]KAH9273944.1 hypothetical protein BASA83_003576 [Batrachochytrium salamandrivorans]
MDSRRRSTITESKQSEKASNFIDVQQQMNIHHFEKIMTLFHSHHNEDGSTGFNNDQFRVVFWEVLGKSLNEEQMEQLFMKIDSNSDGTVDWEEFSAYMMAASIEMEEFGDILDEHKHKLVSVPHKDMIIRIDFVQRERRYLSVSRDGIVCLWTKLFKLSRTINTHELNPKTSWAQDARFMHQHNKLVIVTDDRQLCIYDVFSIKPRLMAAISQLENNPLCLTFAAGYDEETDLILFGDDGGHVNVLSITAKFLVDTASDSYLGEPLTSAKLTKKDSLEKHNISLYRRKIHEDWVLKVQYYPEMNSFVSCAVENNKSLVIGDLERKTLRHIRIMKGIRCFEFCRRPSFLVTGGRDKIIRLWNPYVLSKPAGSLQGHNASVISIVINHEDGHIISLSEDKVVKVWNARSLNCLQTLVDKVPHRPENIISSIYYDAQYRQIITGSNGLEVWPLHNNSNQIITKSHDSPVVSAIFNHNFRQVVSGCQAGTITLWDPLFGKKIFQFHKAHGNLEITAMCFDISGRRLITGSRDGVIKMWNFNNGQIIRRLLKESVMETTDICFVEMGLNRFIIAVGWDRTISIFVDDPAHFEACPTRVLNGRGSGVHKGHEDDISAVAFCPPNVLATSSVDGTIVIWNLESGHIKHSMKDPFLDLRSKEERPVEKLIFVYQLNRSLSRATRPPLLSCHADGCVRVWDVFDGTLMNEFNCQVIDEEGLTTMSCDRDCTLLMVGGSKGHIRIINLKAMLHDGDNCNLKLVIMDIWRAHMQSVSSISYIKSDDMIITCSKDSTVRIWTIKGTHVGTFGDKSWVLGDELTYCPLPSDLKHDQDLKNKRAEIVNTKETLIKKSIIDTWRGASTMFGLEDSGREMTLADKNDRKKTIRRLKDKAMIVYVAKKWKDYWLQRKNVDDWTVTPSLVTVKNSKNFFSYDTQYHPRVTKSAVNVKYESVYHMLPIHPMEDMHSSILHPLKAMKQSRTSIQGVPK